MDVARIEAISPQKIDWRRLTAKEIIKYEQQGVDVPPQYLQWAQEIRNSLDTSDDTTYEKAVSSPAPIPESASTDTQVPIDASTEGEPVVEEPTAQNESGEKVEDKSAAQQKREELQNSGVSLRNQAKIFTQDSKANNLEVLGSAAAIIALENQSVNEIEGLESYMAELLAKAEATQNELKNEVANIDNDNNGQSSIGQINKLQAQLEQYGAAGQASVSSVEGNLIQYESVLNAQSGIILNTMDFGVETVNVGNDLLTSIKGYGFLRILDYIFGKRAVSVGSNAVSNSQTVGDIQNQALASNSDNLSTASGYKLQIENLTGVAGAAQSQSQEDSGAEQNSEQAESEKTVKTAQNDGTDETAKASTNLDEILKRKIRKGENINPENLS